MLISVFILFTDYALSQGTLVVDDKIGIGTNSLGKQLEVLGILLTKTADTGGTAGGMSSEEGGLVSFWTNNNYNPANHTSGWTRTLNLKEGKIGIGTDNPTQAIDMGGRKKNIRFDYGHLGETGGGAATILANGARVSNNVNNRVDFSTSSNDGVSAIELLYLSGISFFTKSNDGYVFR